MSRKIVHTQSNMRQITYMQPIVDMSFNVTLHIFVYVRMMTRQWQWFWDNGQLCSLFREMCLKPFINTFQLKFPHIKIDLGRVIVAKLDNGQWNLRNTSHVILHHDRWIAQLAKPLLSCVSLCKRSPKLVTS